jgi:hypothetical protein
VSLDKEQEGSRVEVAGLAERWQELDRETLVEAQAAIAGGRRFRYLDLVRAPFVFAKTLLGGHPFLRGTAGVIEAGMRAIHTFVLHLRIWSLQHDAERGGEPHEDCPR